GGKRSFWPSPSGSPTTRLTPPRFPATRQTSSTASGLAVECTIRTSFSDKTAGLALYPKRLTENHVVSPEGLAAVPLIGRGRPGNRVSPSRINFAVVPSTSG